MKDRGNPLTWMKATGRQFVHFSGFLLALALTALIPNSHAQAACTVPNSINNGQVADASAVMGNFNALNDCINSAVRHTGTTAAGNLTVFSSENTVTAGDVSGDCTTAGNLTVTCNKTSGAPFGYFSTGTDAGQLTGTISVDRFNGGADADNAHFLRGDGTWASPPAAAPGGWTLIESLSPAAVSSVVSDSWAGQPYKALKFVFRLSASADGSTISVRYKLNGVYKSDANYRYSGASVSSSSATDTLAAATGTSLVIGNAGATWGIGNNILEQIAGEITIYRPFDTSKPKTLNFQTEHGAPSGSYVSTAGGGTFDGPDAASPLAGLQFLISSGTIDGTIDVLALN